MFAALNLSSWMSRGWFVERILGIDEEIGKEKGTDGVLYKVRSWIMGLNRWMESFKTLNALYHSEENGYYSHSVCLSQICQSQIPSTVGKSFDLRRVFQIAYCVWNKSLFLMLTNVCACSRSVTVLGPFHKLKHRPSDSKRFSLPLSEDLGIVGALTCNRMASSPHNQAVR